MLVGKGEKVLVSVASVAVNRRIRSPYSSSRAKPPTGRRSRGTYSCRRHNEQVPPLRLATLGSGRDDGVLILRNNSFGKRSTMSRDGARRCKPDLFAARRDMTQSALEMPQAMRLAHQIGVQGDAHYQRPIFRQLEHL